MSVKFILWSTTTTLLELSSPPPMLPPGLLNALPVLEVRHEATAWKVKQMRGNCTMTSRSHSQAQNPGKSSVLEPIYFLKRELLSFENLRVFLIRACRGIKDPQIGVWSSQQQCYKATSCSKMSLLHSRDLRRGCPSHLSPFQSDWSQDSISKRNLQTQNQRRQWFNKLQNKSKRDLWKCPF